MDGPQVLVEKLDVSPGDLYRSWAVTEDPLEAEDIAPINQERPSERVAEDVGRASGLDARPARESPDELVDTTRRKGWAARADE